MDSSQPVFELRTDPIVGRQVLIAEDRAGRPNDLSVSPLARETASQIADCPFCAGHENRTPESLLEVAGETGPWQVRVVPNKYPAVALDPSLAVTQSAVAPFGAHEVFIESPRHVCDISELSVAEMARVLRVYRQRLRDWSADERIAQVLIFKNVGNPAGASLGHLHSQLVALPTVPAVIAAEVDAARKFFVANERCIFCALLDEELSHGERLVASSESFVAFCASAGRQPYETWILPRAHHASFGQLTDAESDSLAELLQDIVRRLQTQLDPLAYNLILHTAPTSERDDAHFHWHFELVPRSTQLAGFEWGTGMHINPLAPERAATSLGSTP